MRKYKRILLAALAAAAIAGGAAELTGDPSQWGVAKKGSFDITEEMLTAGDEKNGDVPVVPGLAGSRGGMSELGRESALAGSSGDTAEQELIAGASGCRGNPPQCRESS